MNLSSLRSIALLLTFVLFGAALLGCPFVGPTVLSYDLVFHGWPPLSDNRDAQIFYTVRFPRNLLAALAGASMACAGIVFQAVLRNPLACPFTLGVAGGSSFGAVVAILVGFTAAWHGLSVVTLFSFLGALLSLFLLYALAGISRSLSTVTLLLAGIAINYFFNALVLLFYFMADFTQSYAMMHWMIGSLDVIEWGPVGRLFAVWLLAFGILFAFARDLNLLSQGEEWASVKGIPTGKITVLCILVASLLTSSVVALTGPIAFVGLVVPHIYRLWIGNDHRFLLPASVLGGAAFLMVCDTVARSFFMPAELPVGVLTAMIGVPVLLWLLFRQKVFWRG